MARYEKRCPKCSVVIPGRRCKSCNSLPSWAFVVELPKRNGKRRRHVRRGFKTKAEAQEAASEIENQLRTGTRVEPSKITVADWLEIWFARNVHLDEWKPSTAAGYNSLIEGRLKPHLGDIRLQDLNQFDIEAAYAAMSEAGLASGTVRNAHTLLKKALRDAIADKLIDESPATLASPGKVNRAERTSWTPEELNRFRKALEGQRFGPLFRLIAMTGVRRGEALGLRWKDVDLSKGVIHVRTTFTKGQNGAVLSDTKTARSRRSIDIDQGTVDVLRNWRTAQKAESLEFGPAAFKAQNADDLVFTRKDGSPLDPDGVSKAFLRICKPLDVRRITLHELRHTHGSILLKEGVPLHVVSQRLGHSTAEFTATVYSHVLPGQGEEAASKLAAIFDA